MFCGGIDALDSHLNYGWYTRNARETNLTECQFADDVAILATTLVGAELAIRELLSVVENFRLTVNELPEDQGDGGRLRSQ